MRWLITNRNQQKDGFGGDIDDLTFWSFDPASDPKAKIDALSSWKKRTLKQFKAELAIQTDKFPHPIGTPSEQQKHLTLFVHGYDNAWTVAMQRYDTIARQLFDVPDSLGELVCFDWPSEGSLLGYLPDRADARRTADHLTNVLEELYDWMSEKQADAAENPKDACRAKTSIIAHSMGNYALEYAMNALWTRKNRPLLVSLMQEVLMIAADVDNDLFRSGEAVSHGDGEGLANLSYRITALYTGRDNVLGTSAGLKHFGKRRLGRSGLDRTYPLPDNVWDIDCTDLMDQNVNGITVHGEYFNPSEGKIYNLIKAILAGTDRSVLIKQGLVPSLIPKQQMLSA